MNTRLSCVETETIQRQRPVILTRYFFRLFFSKRMKYFIKAKSLKFFKNL